MYFRNLVLIVLIIGLSGCVSDDDNIFVDLRDSNRYETATFSGKTWMIENLKFINQDIFCNGGWIYAYEKDEYNRAISSNISSSTGVLYSWPRANMVCPEGWHLPSVEEWEELITVIYSPERDKLYDFGSLKLNFEGYARTFGKFCIYEGATYWTSSRAENSDDECYAIVMMLRPDATLFHRFEKHNISDAFSIRLVK